MAAEAMVTAPDTVHKALVGHKGNSGKLKGTHLFSLYSLRGANMALWTLSVRCHERVREMGTESICWRP